MELFQRVTPDGTVPEESRPAPDRIIAGDPVHRTWPLDERGTLYAGLWESTPGHWRISYDEWEYCRILSGRSVIRDDKGGEWAIGPGDSFILRPGFRGSWQVIETTRKDYVILA